MFHSLDDKNMLQTTFHMHYIYYTFRQTLDKHNDLMPRHLKQQIFNIQKDNKKPIYHAFVALTNYLTSDQSAYQEALRIAPSIAM